MATRDVCKMTAEIILEYIPLGENGHKKIFQPNSQTKDMRRSQKLNLKQETTMSRILAETSRTLSHRKKTTEEEK